MKRLILAAIFMPAISLIFVTSVKAEESSSNKPDTFMATDMDGILVPYDVITYAQMEYQGRAITNVTKTISQGDEAYKLRVDRDDKTNDYESVFLLYDMDWNLVSEEKMSQPTIPIKNENNSDSKPEKKDNDQKEEKEESRENRKKPDNDNRENTIRDEEEPAINDETDEESAAAGP